MRTSSRVLAAALSLPPQPPTAPHRTEVGARPNIGQADALNLLYAAVTGERGELGAIVRGLLILHQILPGTGRAWVDCSYCRGTGQAPTDDGGTPQHCHCRCDLCACNEPLCAGPCDSLAVMLDALVLRGLPAEAVDVPGALAQLQAEGARRIITRAAGRSLVMVDPADARPDTTKVTVGDTTAADRVERALRDEGYQCERRPVPGPVVAFQLTATPRT